MTNLAKDYKVVSIDFRDQLSPPKTGFDRDVSQFLERALEVAMEKFEIAIWDKIDDQATQLWFELMEIPELFDATARMSVGDLEILTGLSEDEINMLKATAAAEVIGINITDLEKSAAHHNIYSSNFPNRKHGTPSYPYRDDLSGKPAP